MIIPVEQVESVEIVAESYMFSSMKSEEINKINQKYNDFCREYLQK
jgi:hypothetical protein